MKIEKLVLSLRSTESTNAQVLEKLRTEADYFGRNAERMAQRQYDAVDPANRLVTVGLERMWIEEPGRVV